MYAKRPMSLVIKVAILAVVIAACSPAATSAPAATEAPAAQATEAPAAQATEAPAVQPTEAPAATGGEVVELNYFERNNAPATWAEANWVVDSFNQENAGKIHVTISGVDGVTYRTKAPIELRSETPPDVFFSWEGGWAQKMIDSGFAAPLDEYYDQYGWGDTLSKGGVSLATFGGTKYFVPYEMSAAVMWYRPDVYEQYSLSVPKTWDEFISNCDILKQNGVACMLVADQAKWPAQFEWTSYFVNASGLDTYEKLIHNEIPWTDQSVVDALAEMHNLAADGYLYPGWNSIDITPGLVPFSQGQVANWFQGTWMINDFKGDAADLPYPVDFFPFPQVGSQDPVMSVFAENTLMIHANSPHKAEAAEFINYYVSKTAQQHKVDSQLPFPANTEVDLSPLVPLAQKVGQAMSQTGEFTFMHVDHQFDPAIADVFLTQLQGVFDGAISPEDAAAAVEAEAVKVRGPVQ